MGQGNCNTWQMLKGNPRAMEQCWMSQCTLGATCPHCVIHDLLTNTASEVSV